MVSRPLAALLVAASLTTGCTSDRGDQTDVPLRADAVGSRFQQDAVLPENGTAPDAFVGRERLPSCGSYAWTLGDGGPPDHMWRCLADSLENGDAAELIVQSPGTDSTVVSYYRAEQDGEELQVWVHDSMGDQWWRGTCTSLDAVDGPGPCEADEMFG